MNSGWFKDSFWFCDATPPSSSPFIDYNTGVIEGSVRYCTSVGFPNVDALSMSFFPNPAKNNITVLNTHSIKITDITGKQVLNAFTHKLSQINIEHLKEGVYFISLIHDHNNTVVRKLIIE